MTINNSCEINGSMITSLKGEKLISFLDGEQKIELVFLSMKKIKIGMSPDVFHGPEAMVLSMPGCPLVIWN